MNADNPLPRDLRLVALFFLLGGISAAITIVFSLLHNQLQLDFGVLGIFVSIGLRGLSNGWRICALVLIWMCLILSPIIAVLALGIPHANFNLFGFIGPEIPPFFVTLISAFWFAVAMWERRVLTRPDIMELFIINQYPDSESPWR